MHKQDLALKIYQGWHAINPQQTNHDLLVHIFLISKGHCWRSRDDLISNVLQWTPTYGRAKAGRPVRTYIQQLCEDTGRSPEDLPEGMNDREKWWERVRDIRAGGWHDDDDDDDDDDVHYLFSGVFLVFQRQKNQPFFIIVLTWSASLLLVGWKLAHSCQISIILFLYRLWVGLLLK